MDTLDIVHIEQDEGLSQLNALTLDFDEQGYLWIGTENGLNRFNGYEMEVFKSGNAPGDLPDDHIRSMYQAHDTLWLATNTHSVCAYLLAEDRFVSFEDSLDLARYPGAKFAYTIKPLDDRYLLAGTIDHCILIDRKELTFEILDITHATENEYITATVPYGKGSYLLGTNFSGTHIFDLKEKTIRPFSIKNEAVNAFYPLDRKRILVGTNNGLFILDKNSGEFKQLPMPGKNTRVRSLFRWDDRHLLVGGVNKNYLLTDDFRWQQIVFTDGQKPLNTTVLCLQKDNQGGQWMGTEGRGVFYYHPKQKKFTPYRIRSEKAPKQDFISIFNFLREGDTVWMATEFGIARYQESTEDYKVYLTNKLEYTLAKDASGRLWAGGFEEGLLRYNRAKDIFEHAPLPFKDKDVIHITPMSNDTIWLHTWSDGIYAYNVHTHQARKKVIMGKSLIRSRNSLIDTDGDIWLASDNGLYRITEKQDYYYDSLSNERIFSITEYPKGQIWVGTGRGLNRLDKNTGQITHYYEQEGLPNDFIYGVESDAGGSIWVSTNYGLSELDLESGTFKNYTELDGLQNNEFNGKASYKDDAGRLYFGGMNGFNVFHPDSISVNQHVGATVIENVQLFGKPLERNIPYQDTLTLKYTQNVITFNFANLSFLWPKKNHYQFMLEGFDKDWRPITRERSTTYTNLDPGSYTFKVKGSNNEFKWGNTASLSIIIESPWYETDWFGALVVLFSLVAIFLFFLLRDLRQKALNRRLSRMVDERTEELTEANRALNVSLELTHQQKENISFLMRELNHRVKNNLQLINSLIDFQKGDHKDHAERSRLEQLQSRVFTVSRIHDLLDHGGSAEDDIRIDRFVSRLANDLIDFSGSDIEVQLELPPLEFRAIRVTYVGLILNELITNSIKHAFDESIDHKTITIQLLEQDESLLLIYYDNGKGFQDKESSPGSLGLNLMSVLTGELDGSLDIDSSTGAVFRFSFKKSTLLSAASRQWLENQVTKIEA